MFQMATAILATTTYCQCKNRGENSSSWHYCHGIFTLYTLWSVKKCGSKLLAASFANLENPRFFIYQFCMISQTIVTPLEFDVRKLNQWGTT